jgi:hypothetical protein
MRLKVAATRLTALASVVALSSCLPSFNASTTASASIGRGLRRLSHREYNNVVRDLLGDSSQPADQLGDEIYVNGFDNGSDGLTVLGSDVTALQSVAETLAARAVTSNLSGLIGSCDPKQDEGACVDAFLTGFTKRAYRRPPTDGEVARLRTVYAAGAAASGFTGGIQLMLEAILQSPAFLYRAELGTANGPGSVHLTDYEIASELSFLITGSMPDDALFAAADSGRLATADDLRREATRLIQSPAAQPAFRSFLHQWMATDRLDSLSKDQQVYPTFTPALAASMAGELDRYFDSALFGGTGSLRELFTSSQSFVDATLAPVYQVAAPQSGFQSVALDPQIRRGILTRAGFLAAHSDTDSSGPVPRGVFVLEALLCQPPSPPPPNVGSPPSVTTAKQQHQTTRQRFDAHLNQDFCKGCHTQIDGVGFGFEEFDGMGVFRTTENGSPVDTSGQLVGTDVDGPFVGAGQLADKLVGSQQVLNCFVKQVYRFAMGQQESDASGALLSKLGSGFTADAPVTDLFMSLIGDPAFVERSTLQTSP